MRATPKEAAMRLHLSIFALPMFALCLITAPVQSAKADSLEQKGEEMGRMADEAVTKLMRALDLLITTMPRYAAPEVLPNGDIIIRRLDPQEQEQEPIETGAGADSIET
jgi:hypothetical protein